MDMTEMATSTPEMAKPKFRLQKQHTVCSIEIESPMMDSSRENPFFHSIMTAGPEVTLSLPLDNLPSALLQKGSFQCYDKSSGNMVNKDTNGKIRNTVLIFESFDSSKLSTSCVNTGELLQRSNKDDMCTLF